MTRRVTDSNNFSHQRAVKVRVKAAAASRSCLPHLFHLRPLTFLIALKDGDSGIRALPPSLPA